MIKTLIKTSNTTSQNKRITQQKFTVKKTEKNPLKNNFTTIFMNLTK